MANGDRTNRKPLPPYPPYSRFVTFVDGLRSLAPFRIDHSVLGGCSSTVRSWLLNGLRYMKLVDENDAPTQRLRKLANAQGDLRKRLLKELFDATYGPLEKKGLDPSSATPAELKAAFRDCGAQGETIKKCVAFFSALARDAGVPLSPMLKPAVRRPSSSLRTYPVPSSTDHGRHDADSVSGSHCDRQPIHTPEQTLLAMLNPEVMSEAEQQAIWTLLLHLKKQELGGVVRGVQARLIRTSQAPQRTSQ
jgi:hypothetical protein